MKGSWIRIVYIGILFLIAGIVLIIGPDESLQYIEGYPAVYIIHCHTLGFSVAITGIAMIIIGFCMPEIPQKKRNTRAKGEEQK